MLAIVCPGQGSQTPGFLSPWLELPGLREKAIAWSEATGADLVLHGTTSDADTIRDTAVAQPLIVGAGLLALDALYAALPGTDGSARTAGVLAGHSVGEITAAVATGVLGPEEGLTLVGVRGRAMAAASALTPTGMSAVLGGDPQEVLDALAAHGLTPANTNGAGQVVAAGTIDQLDALAADPPAKARVIALSVAGAFHTVHMAPAVDAMQEQAATITPHDPSTTLLSNADGEPVGTGDEVLTRLVSQVSNPVRWDLCMETMTRLGVTGLIELAPAGTLVGLAKRAMKGVELLALKTPEDLDAARDLVARHTAAPSA
ncbi:ACP S-malonyltransferase [Lapillicoccus sp.]|uniref:ACP S-malonyltransferase n=1 Tax=Lapillicoccus sp. TaxID=1909287 RepID=UPI0025DDBCEB|nr:ACP S-malonyltransferase [Lapillicoccus sp.]